MGSERGAQSQWRSNRFPGYVTQWSRRASNVPSVPPREFFSTSRLASVMSSSTWIRKTRESRVAGHHRQNICKKKKNFLGLMENSGETLKSQNRNSALKQYFLILASKKVRKGPCLWLKEATLSEEYKRIISHQKLPFLEASIHRVVKLELFHG